MSRRTLAILAGGLALLAAAGAAAYGLAESRYRGFADESVLLEIPRGAAPAEVAAILHSAGVIRSPGYFRVLIRLRGASGVLKAGEYLFRGETRPGRVLDRIVRGEVYLHRVTIPEGLAGRRVLERLRALHLVGSGDLEEAYRDVSLIEDLDPAAEDLEGYLFPDTYYFPRGATAGRILKEMTTRFRQELEPEILTSAARQGMSLREVVTLASLIEKETSLPEERERISAVFHNRLKIGMALQCDPTVIYALAADGLYDGVLTREDLEYESDYNTYIHPGLPPGPIASPGGASLRAAVEPLDVKDLYFVADGTGGHAFSRSLEDHLRAVQRYRRVRRSGA